MKKLNTSKIQQGRLKHLYTLWNNSITADGIPQFDKWIANEFKKNTKFGSNDRRWYTELLFAGIRYGYFALFCNYISEIIRNNHSILTKNSSQDFNINEHLLKFKEIYSSTSKIISDWRNMDSQAFFNWIMLKYNFEVDKHTSTVNSIVEVSTEDIEIHYKLVFDFILGHINSDSISNLLLINGIPLWFEEYMQERIQYSKWTEEDIKTFLSRQNIRPPLWLRINQPNQTKLILNSLNSEQFKVELFENLSIKTYGKASIYTTAAYKNGLVEIQDLASQKIGLCLKLKPGDLVWDSCAGGGGKTLHLASLTENKATIYASDVRHYKLEEVKIRAKRAAMSNIRYFEWNGNGLPDLPAEVKKNGGFNWILIDAPCSSSGTWRRNPDAKYRTYSENIASLTELQLSIIQKVKAALKPGGFLVYSTCSWLVQENENVVKRFLDKENEFSLLSQQLFGNPTYDSDTMFAAVMQKAEK